MEYSIGEVAKRYNIAASTLRYYDKEGLLPFVERKESGIRSFSDTDLLWLDIIECLKNTGMSIKEIKEFIDWCMEGDATLQQRYDMFQERKAAVEQQMASLQRTLNTIKYKCWYYKTALDAGTEKIHGNVDAKDVPRLAAEYTKEKTP